MTCPHCATRLVQRAAHQDLREFLWSLLMVYPFRCQLCTHRFVRFLGRPSHNPKRDYQRMLVRYPVSFGPSVAEREDVRGEGMMRNLSIRGCAIESDAPVHQGASLYVRFDLGDGKAPLEVDRAAVRFTTGTRIGLEFLELSPEHEGRLRHILESRLSSLPRLTHS